MATVRLAPVLRTFAGGSKQVSAQGNNLAEVLNDLYGRFPALQRADSARRKPQSLHQHLCQ